MKIVVKVDIYCQKCKTDVLKAVAKLEGVDQVSIDGEKGTLTVVGSVDPVLVAKKVRRTGKMAEILSVGPPKKPDSPIKPPTIPLPICCNHCQIVLMPYTSYDAGSCSIL
ncbi:hypothetical protein LguiB_006464 [Lonicera macranthoides]